VVPRSLLLLGLAVAITGRAAEPDCRPDGLLLFPAPGAVVPTNVQWILEGVGAEQTRVSDLVGAQGLTLLADDGSSVPLKVERGWVSQAKRVAVRLKASKALSPDSRYTLVLGSSLGGAVFLNELQGESRPTWRTASTADRDAPKYRSKPAVSEGWYSAGPTLVRQLRLRVAVEEKGSAYFVVTMQRMRGSSVRQQYPVPLVGESIIIGHDACGGSFGFEDGRAYRLVFELFDSAGNHNAERVSLEVSAPRPPR
jgi:hypothetical protein